VIDIQALVILSTGAGFRGETKLGASLLTIAMRTNHDLPFPVTSSENITTPDELRIRVSASRTAHLFDALVCPR
jgi:hypothetical protein